MVLSQLGNLFLLSGIILGSYDFIHPPLIAACCGEHASHEMEPSVGCIEGVKRVVVINTELRRRDKNGTAGTKRDITISFAYGSGCNRCGCIVSGACCNDNIL